MINTDFLHSVQNGDEDAIQSLIRAHQRQVFQLALSILDTSKTDPAEAARQAEIATRETFMTAVDHIGRYREDTNFNLWLYGLTIQVALRRARRWHTQRVLGGAWSKVTRQSEEGSFYERKPAPAPAPVRAPAAEEETPAEGGQSQHPNPSTSDATLWDAVRGLDERLRLPVVLRYYHDFSIAEIAALLKISEGSVHARLDRARDKLAGK